MRLVKPDDDEGRQRGHHDDIDWAAHAPFLSAWDDIAEPLHRAIVDWLDIRQGQIAVDVGSGAGGMTAVLAEAVGAQGIVIAVDRDVELLNVAAFRAAEPVHDLITIDVDLEQERLHDVIPEYRVDLLHAGNVVHHLDDEVAAIRDLAAAVRPGGRVVLVEGGLTTRFLPSDCGIGEPGLEQRLAAAHEAWFWSEIRPAPATVRTGRGWGLLLAEAGLVEVAARSFLLDVPAPLDDRTRRVVREILTSQAARVGDRLDESDRATLARLLDPDDPAGVMRRDDVYILGARTAHVGTVPL